MDEQNKPDGGRPMGLALEGRNGEIWRAYTIYQKTQEAIAQEFGISQARVSQIVREVRASIPENDREEMRQESLELYREMTRRALEIADLVPAPLVAGKDGEPVIDPETHKPVRDYTGRLRAMETALKFDLERRKLMGLDSATKVETSGAVRFEIVGVDVDDLT
jgi:hypothetical protein